LLASSASQQFCGHADTTVPSFSVNWRIKPDAEPGLEQWLKLNADMAKSWPNITIKKDAPADAKEFDGVAGKFEAHFSSNPGEGD